MCYNVFEKLNSLEGAMEFYEFTYDEISELSYLDQLGFEFGWSARSSENSKTVSYLTDATIGGLVEFESQPHSNLNYMYLIEVAKEYHGTGVAGKLLAYVANDSLEQGFEVFVVFESKTALVNYYIVKYGAQRVRAKGRHLFFDEQAARKLIEEYL